MRAAFLFNGRFLTQKITGVQRYAIETVSAISALLGSDKAIIAAPSQRKPEEKLEYSTDFSPIVIDRRSRFSGHIWEQFSLPFYRRTVLFNFCNTYPVFAGKQIVVLHDASVYAVPEGYTRGFVLFYRLLFWLLKFKSSTRIVTDSEYSRKEIAKYAGIAESRIAVVHCGADHWRHVVPQTCILEKLGLSGRQYFLAVASANPNKNLDRLMRAYSLLSRSDIPLVLVGGNNSRVFASESDVTSTGVVRAGYVSDAELAALYASATAFIFPSLYEGFGLPPLEAMTFGCPVISSREASLPEVCGNAALYCDAYDSQDIAAAMRHLLDDENLRASLVVAGRLQVEKFRWRDTAQAILDIAREMA